MQPTFKCLRLQLALLAFLAAIVSGQGINPVLPADLAQCRSTTLSWSSVGIDIIYTASIVQADTVGPYNEIVLTPLGRFIDETSVQWDVAYPAGTNVVLRVNVENRTTEYSQAVIIAPGSDRCLPDHYYDRIGSHGGKASDHGTGMVNGGGRSIVSGAANHGWTFALLVISSLAMTHLM